MPRSTPPLSPDEPPHMAQDHGVTRRSMMFAAGGAGAAVVAFQAEGAAQAQVAADAMRQAFRPQDFAAPGKFATGGDDHEAMQAAQDAAFAAKGCVELPRGTILVSRTVIVKAPTRGDGPQTTIIKAMEGPYWRTERKPNRSDDMSNSYMPILQVGRKPQDKFRPIASIYLSSLRVQGLCKRTKVPTGDRNDLGFFGDGIHVADLCRQPSFLDVWVMNCQNGWNTFNSTGHVTWINCQSSNNFFGWWVDWQSGDYRMYGTNLDGNMFSSVGLHGSNTEIRKVTSQAGQCGINGWAAFGGHLGFGPFAVWQTDRGEENVAGMSDVTWVQNSMEACGNRGIQLAERSLNARWMMGTIGTSFYAPDGRYTIPHLPAKDYFYWIGVMNRSSRFEVPYDAVGSSGKLGRIGVIQGTMTMPGGWAKWETNNQDRVVDYQYANLEVVVEVRGGTTVGAGSSQVAHIEVPKDIRYAGSFKARFEGEVIAASAIESLRMEIHGGDKPDGSDAKLIGAPVRCPVLAGHSYLNVSRQIPGSGHAHVFLHFVGDGQGVELGVKESPGQFALSPSRRAV